MELVSVALILATFIYKISEMTKLLSFIKMLFALENENYSNLFKDISINKSVLMIFMRSHLPSIYLLVQVTKSSR